MNADREKQLQSWVDHKVLDVVNKKVADMGRVARARQMFTWKPTAKAKAKTNARFCVLRCQDPDLMETLFDKAPYFQQRLRY